ncbi:hypothetical protein FQA39_LY00819 [Lamprigera yunnana]|nr:hypothetical protein FQA39_LY00819 [Lamprigera yunnana]
MSTITAAPLRVSPVIKFGRWSLLTMGIMYGMFHQRRLGRKEAAIRVVENKQKAERDAKIALEKKIASDKEMYELERMAGMH